MNPLVCSQFPGQGCVGPADCASAIWRPGHGCRCSLGAGALSQGAPCLPASKGGPGARPKEARGPARVEPATAVAARHTPGSTMRSRKGGIPNRAQHDGLAMLGYYGTGLFGDCAHKPLDVERCVVAFSCGFSETVC